MRFVLDLAPEAEADIDDILEWSVVRFGAAVRDGYEELINAVIRSILNDPEGAGSHDRPDIGRGIRVIHLAAGRDGIPRSVRRIAAPRHFVVYRRVGRVVQVVRVLHDAMNLPEQHIP